jgi:hypothetical protein
MTIQATLLLSALFALGGAVIYAYVNNRSSFVFHFSPSSRAS